MSGMMNKIKEAVIGPADSGNTATDNTHGPGGASTHRSGAGLAGSGMTHDTTNDRSTTAKLTDPRSDFDNVGTTTKSTGYGSQHVGGTSTNAGPHDSNVANKLDPRVDSDRDNRGAYGTTGAGMGGATHGTSHSTTAGPHQSNVANKLDPRVDSDRDNRGAYGTTGTGMGGASHGTSHSTTAGPHQSNVANKLDPRVDSDRDNRGAYGTTGTGMGGTSHGTTGIGMGGASHGTSHSTTAGPHQSNVANKLDPRVDSDRDNRGAHGTTGTTSGTTAGGYPRSMLDVGDNTSTAGPHQSNVANKLDPRVDSDRDGRNAPGAHDVGSTKGTGSRSGAATHSSMAGNTGGTTHKGTIGSTTSHLPGPAPHTAGPHKSDILNKLDPRVDSNLDGSKTIGSAGGQTRGGL